MFRPCTDGNLARHSCSRAISAGPALLIWYSISLTADERGTDDAIGAAFTFGRLSHAARICSRTDTGVPSLNETNACCWPSALLNCEHPVSAVTPTRGNAMAGITTRG